jgi:hypothetical protein
LAARLPYCSIGSPASSASMLAVVTMLVELVPRFVGSNRGSFLSAAHYRYRQSGC